MDQPAPNSSAVAAATTTPPSTYRPIRAAISRLLPHPAAAPAAADAPPLPPHHQTETSDAGARDDSRHNYVRMDDTHHDHESGPHTETANGYANGGERTESGDFDDIPKEQRFRHVSRSFLVLIALVMYFHGVYAIFAVLAAGSALHVALVLSLASAAVLTWEDTLADIMAIDIYSDIIKFDTENKGFLCGIMDADLHKCCGVSCSVSICFHRRLYVSRLFYYNFNAALLSLTWLGVDVILSTIIDAATNWRIGERIGMDLFFFVVANVILISQHQMLAQFGVIGDKAVLYVVDKPVPVMEEDNKIINHPMTTPSRLSQSRKHILDASHGEDAEAHHHPHHEHDHSHDGAHREAQPPQRHVAVMAGHTLHRPLIVESPPDPATTGDSNSNSLSYLMTYWMVRLDKALRVLLCFFALCMYWCAIWDMVGSIPSAEILKADSGDGDDGSFTDDFYERRNPGTTDAEFKMFLLGFSYVVGAAVYLLLTGEIFTIVRTNTKDAKRVS